ncbi:MAG: PEP-CTERM sorting domain-containing protein [candidate division Zixibacteria bacterium]|nr:PEP-CTERM sorting domain-containing protein [candidate division Zixibacteria bacterium]
MKKLLVIFSAVLLLTAFSGSALALTWATSMAEIYAAGGLDVAIPGNEYDFMSSIADPFGGTITFDKPVEKRIVGSSWTTWSHGYTGPVLAAIDQTSVRLDFDYAIFGWGMYVEPNNFDFFDITVGLSDGSTSTKLVEGFAGAEFFGFTDGAINWLEISADPDAFGFAFGEMVMAKEGGVVPEPTTVILFGLGLLGLGAMKRRKK